MTTIEKNCRDIRAADAEKIAFSGGETYHWTDFERRERDIAAKRPYFAFSSARMRLVIYFDQRGLFAKRKQFRAFHDFHSKLNDWGIITLDLS
jgi:hypothetical protein